jgi:HEAT repeat protein
MASGDSSSHVRASAIEQMSRWNDRSLLPQIEKSLFDSSYLVIATALDVLFSMDSVKAYQSAAVLENDSSEEIVRTLTGIYARMGGPEKTITF